MKKFSLWLKLAIGFQLLTAFVHSLSFFTSPQPKNDTERELVNLVQNYKLDLGAGFHRSTAQLMLALSLCFTLVCLLGGLINWHLLRKKIASDVLVGVININLIVFGICFGGMLLFTFLPPIILTGLIFVFLILARLTIAEWA